MWKRLVLVFSCFCFCFTLLYLRLFFISTDEKYAEMAVRQTTYTVNVGKTYANIYDANFRPLINERSKTIASVYPSQSALSAIAPHVKDREVLQRRGDATIPFVCELDSQVENEDVDIFNIPIRYSDEQIAPHIIGYTRDNIGVSGLERAYDDFLRGNSSQVSIEYSADGIRQLVLGDNKTLIEQKNVKAGVVTTLDKDIQKLAEKVARENAIKGAIVIMDPYTGEIKAMVSMPDFSPLSLDKSINDDENYPLVNRALSGYNLGSIFKLATASAALEQGINTDLEYDCKGYVDVKGQIMKCHKLDGHGLLDMEGAIVNSCNTYFIELASEIDDKALLSTASALSFGKSVNLATGMRSVNGYLQNKGELYNPAEKANLSFGQGMLLATPIQVAQMTSAFVNGGRTPRAFLVKGLSYDGETIDIEEAAPAFTNAISKNTANKIKKFMIDTVEDESNEKFNPTKTTAGGKTATAQTGKMDKDDKEILHGWLTGFTPANEPKYVITILVEGGGYGSSSAGPAFSEICDKLYELDELRAESQALN